MGLLVSDEEEPSEDLRLGDNKDFIREKWGMVGSSPEQVGEESADEGMERDAVLTFIMSL